MKSLSFYITLLICTIVPCLVLGDATLYTNRRTWQQAVVNENFFNTEDWDEVPPQELEANTVTVLGQVSVEHQRESGSGLIAVISGDDSWGEDTVLDGTNHLYLILDGPMENLAHISFPSPVMAWGAEMRVPDYGDSPSLQINGQDFSSFLNTAQTSFIGFVSDTPIQEVSFFSEGEDSAFLGMDDVTWADQGTAPPTPAPIIPKVYLGCYQDSEDERVFEVQLELNAASGQQCADACADVGYDYSGRQSTQQCWCGGPDYDKIGTSTQCQCDQPDIGDFVNCVWGPDPNFT